MARPLGRVSPGEEVRVQVRPPWPFKLRRRGGMDGLSPVRSGVLHRLLHVGGQAVHVRVAQLRSGDVLIGAMPIDHRALPARGVPAGRGIRAQDRVEATGGDPAAAARAAITRMRRALGVDLDLREFYERFRADPLIGASLRASPALRPVGRPSAFEALAWAITEQLIDYERAVAVQRRIVAVFGSRDPDSKLRDSPSAEVLSAVAPARLQSFDLAGARALALMRAAREVAAGQLDLEVEDPVAQAAGWERLRRLPGIGAWTVEILALCGQGRLDQLPAGDLALLKLVGRLNSDGDPHARADEQQVRVYFERFGRWRGLAASHALHSVGPFKNALVAV